MPAQSPAGAGEAAPATDASAGAWGDGNALADTLLEALPGTVEIGFRQRNNEPGDEKGRE